MKTLEGKGRLLVCGLIMAGTLLHAGAETCQGDKPQAIVGIKINSIGGTASLIGFSEFTNPSAPPRKYRRKATSGIMYYAQWNGTECTTPDNATVYDHAGVHDRGDGVFYRWRMQTEVAEITESLIRYRMTDYLSEVYTPERGWYSWGHHRLKSGNTIMTQVGDEGVVSKGRPVQFWVDTGGGNPTIMTDSTFEIGLVYLNQRRDEWNAIKQHDKDDPSGASLLENSDTSVRYTADAPDFPLSAGGNASGPPKIDDYGLFTIAGLTSTVRSYNGSGLCTPLPNSGTIRGKMQGTRREELGDEDTEEDAMKRAFLVDQAGNPISSGVQRGSDPTAYRARRTSGFDIPFRDVEFEVPVNIACEGEYQVHFNFRKVTRGDTGAAVSFTRTLQKQFKPGQVTLKGRLDVQQMKLLLPGGGNDSLEYDADYTFMGATLGSGCDKEDPGAASFRRDSVHVRLGLGRDANGQTAGALLLDADTITPALYAPAALAADTLVNGATVVVKDENGTLRQMKGPSALADVVTIDENAYEVSFYAADQVGSADPNTGIYAVGGAPYVVFKIENPDAGSGGTSRLRITESRGNLTKATLFAYDGTNAIWTLSEGNGVRQESAVIERLGTAGRIEHITVRDQNDQVVSRLDRIYFNHPWGEEIIAEVLDPEGAALTTSFQYISNPAEPGFGRLRTRTNPDDSSETHAYDAAGRLVRIERPFVTGTPVSSGPQTRVIQHTYDTLADADGDGLPENLTTTVEHTFGQETARSCVVEWSKPVVLDGEAFARRSDIRCTVAAAAWDAPGSLVTETLSYTAGPFEGRHRRVLNPDGTAVLITCASDGTGQTTTTVKSGAPNAGRDDIVSGSRTVTFVNAQGRTSGESTGDIASGRLLASWTATQFDSLGRPTRLDHSDGTYETRDYACCGLASQRDRSGAVTSYQYDALGRQTHVTRDGLTTRTGYDPEGRVVSVTRIGTDSSEIALEGRQYDLAGRLIQRRDALNRLTTYDETVGALGFSLGNGLIRTITGPDGGTRIEKIAAGGLLLSVSGTATAPRTYEYGIDADGFFAKETLVGEDGAATEWTKSYTDVAGRAIKTVHADGATTRSFYNAAGQLVRQVDPDGVTMLFAYNARGEQEVTALDIDGSGTIDYDGSDRITRTVNEVASRDTDTVQRSTSQAWEADGQDTAVIVAISEQSADGLRSWQTAQGLTTNTVTAYDGSGGRTVTVTAPDGVQSSQYYSGDRLVSTTIKTANGIQLMAATNTYDAHGRLQASTDARNGTTTYVYNNDDSLHSVTTPAPVPGRSGPGYDPQSTIYAYDDAGRVSGVTQPDGGVVHTTYWPTGAVKRTWGARTYPVEYSYDPQGRVKTMTTWQDLGSDSGRAVTRWNYNPARGWLDNKRYADNTGPGYHYKPSGRLSRRTWARGLQTGYTYSAAGDLTHIDYSDATPDVTMAYDRLGRPRTITDGSGSRTLDYEASGQLKDEDYTAGLLNGLGVHRSFDPLSRLDAVSALTAASMLNQVAYGYDTASRLDTVTHGSNTATYGYVPSSPLVGSVTIQQGGATRLVTTRTYDNLNRLSAIVSQISNLSSQISAAYTYNSANQRTKVDRENGTHWDYTYDALGQVTSGKKSTAAAAVLPGHDFAWTYDDIGNRKTASADHRISGYSANMLNQYDHRTVPGTFDLLAAAEPDARVSYKYPDTTGTWTPVPRVGEFLHKELTADNSKGGVNAKVRVMGVKSNAGPNGEDAVTDITRATYLPQTPLTFGYDADGNLTADGRWIYEWDGENRLITQQTSASAIAAGVARQRLDFAYDNHGRRVAKNVSNWDGAAWALASSTLFLYDGWNLLADLNALNSNSAVHTYVWGLDLSGSLQGAGGVGGLLFASNPALGSPLHAPCYDGNGNIIAYVDMATGAKSATYEYNAFGEAIIADGPKKDAFPFRFSTKYTDDETGLLYYGLRYFCPSAGRWLSKDQLNELGEDNVYCMIGNDPISFIDIKGLYRASGHFYTVYAVAVSRGYTADEAYELAFYAQVPDQFTEYSAFEGVGRHVKDRTLNSEWLRKIQERLHSLHRQDVSKWRDCLSKLLKSDQLFNVERGLLLHALGDAYAHTKKYSDGSEVSYGYPYGHANAEYGGNGPDLPSLRPELYREYVDALVAALPGGKHPNNRLLLEQTRNSPIGLPSNPIVAEVAQIEKLIMASGYKRKYRPELGLNKNNQPKGSDALGIPSEQLVNRLLEKIENACCQK